MSGAQFVQFCLQVYSLPGVRETCLNLQDNHGWNVNCLLLAVFAARHGWNVDASAWGNILENSSPVRERAVLPIRELRRRLSKDAALDAELRAPLKRLLLYAEIRAEQAEERLQFRNARRLATPAEPGMDLLRANLAAYHGAEPMPDAVFPFLDAVRDAVEQKVPLA